MLTIEGIVAALADEVRAKLEQDVIMSPSAADVAEGLEKYYSVSQVAQSLGVSRPTVYRLINGGILPVTKIGACTRISAAALEDAVGKGLTKKYRRI